MIVICTKAPVQSMGFKPGDVFEYRDGIFLFIGRNFIEETQLPKIPIFPNTEKTISLHWAHEYGLEFKPIDAGHGNFVRIWFKKYRVQRHPDWEVFPDRWDLLWSWRWSEKWKLISEHKSKQEANDSLLKIWCGCIEIG